MVSEVLSNVYYSEILLLLLSPLMVNWQLLLLLWSLAIASFSLKPIIATNSSAVELNSIHAAPSIMLMRCCKCSFS